ncbi:MAG: PPOX class F420-dependent oxidoreductase [Nitrososphaerota archaeon]
MAKLDQKAVDLIEKPNFGYLATLNKDGSPQVTPVWVDYDRENNYVLVNTAIGRVKQKNVKRDPRVSLAVADASNQYNKVIIRGRVVEVTMDGADEHIDKMAKKYLGKDRYPWKSSSEKRVIIKIKPERVVY